MLETIFLILFGWLLGIGTMIVWKWTGSVDMRREDEPPIGI